MPAQKKMIHCNRCGGDTNHFERGSHDQHFDYEDSNDWEAATYRLWACAGCDTAVMERTESASYIPDDGSIPPTYFPERSNGHLRRKTFRKIPPKLRAIYQQTIGAYNAKLYLLCGGGLRALVEGICSDKGIQGKNLEKKIDGMATLLPQAVVANLHGFRFMGNEALHQLDVPKQSDLRIAIEVAEDLLNFLYDLDYKASLLPKKSPKMGGV